jgi:hypothetical protein
VEKSTMQQTSNNAANFDVKTKSYFDYGLDTDCPINFKLSGHDDYSYGKFSIKKPFHFFDNVYSYFYINSNGFVSFSYYDPASLRRFPISSVSVIAPFWSDIDMRFGGSIYHREINQTNILKSIGDDIKKRCPNLSFTPQWAYMVTWSDAPSYLSLDERNGEKSQYRNVFQLMMVTNGQAVSFAIYNYARLDWPNEKINSTFQAGYNSADSVFFVLENANKSTLIGKSNINKPGRWVLPLNNKLNC